MVRLSVLVTGLIFPGLALAQPPAADDTAAAKATSPAGAFTQRLPGNNGFRVLPKQANLFPGDLLIALPGASLVSSNGAVTLKSFADFDGRSPLPILETALTLNAPKDADLDFTLDRGRVDLTNKKASGAAVVRARFWDQQWKITLDAPGTRVALELCGRWPAGSRFRPADAKGAKPGSPVASLVLLVLSGSASADIGGVTLGLKAPPGPALVEWDSVAGTRPQSQKLERLPAWADPEAGLSAEGRRRAAVVEKFQEARAADPTGAIERFLASSDPFEQRVGLVMLGATDDLTRLAQEMAGAKTLEEWDFGITVVRHWLGRCAGQDQKLFDALIARGYSTGQAMTLMQLLLGFTADDLSRPETYGVLIEYLRHGKPAIRNVAAWHLVRLVPKGKSIPFKPDGTPAEMQEAYKAWKELIPNGQLPPGKKE